MSTDPVTDRETLAAELAMGLLEGQDRASALRLMLADADFARTVETWRARLAPLYDAYPDVTAPEGLLRQIDALIDAEAEPVSTVAPMQRRARPSIWKITTFGASAVAAALTLALVLPRNTPVPQTATSPDVAVAQLSGPIDGLLLTARYASETAEMLVRVEGMPVTDTEPELWIVPADGQPRRLGRLLRGGVTRIAVPEGHRQFIDPASQLILTMEPKVLPDPNRPSAPTVAQGRLQRI
ncbi:anti-sigma factor domain-containing protein [Blastomonas sp.]|uniref:anti-sigma factor n=1 Tax=Blastomonas sp. TaxID=1909299 RepID=UPI00359434FB